MKVYLASKSAIAPVLRALFTSPEFAASIGAKTRTPFEDLAATVRTLGYGPAAALGGTPARAAGPWPGDVSVPGGAWRLGSTPADGFVFDNEKWAHAITIAPFTEIP